MTSTSAPAAAAAKDGALKKKTLTRKERRIDKPVAWLGASLCAVCSIALWWLSRTRFDLPSLGRAPGGGTPVGYALGALTVFLYAVAGAYAWRHRRRVQELAMTRTWMEVHLAFGLLSGLTAVLHSGPKLGAPAHGAFLGAWLLLIGTGVVGKVISVVVPRRLTRIEDEALLVEDVVDRQKAMRTQVEELLQDADEASLKLANDVVPRKIASPDWYGARRMRHADAADAVYQTIGGDALLSPERRDWLKRVVACLVEEAFLSRMLTYHYLLRAWVPVHVALTFLCLPWLVFHVLTVFLL